MDVELFALFGGCGIGKLSSFQVAEQLFNVVLEAVFDFAQCGGAQPRHCAFVAAGAHHAGFIVAGDAHAGDFVFNDLRHQQFNAVAIGIAFDYGANFLFPAQHFFDGFQIAPKRGGINFQPRIGGFQRNGFGRGGIAIAQHRRGLGDGGGKCAGKRGDDKGFAESCHD